MNLSYRATPAENPLWAGLEAYCMRKSDAYDAVRFMTSSAFTAVVAKIFNNPADYVATMRVYPFNVVDPATTVPKTTMTAGGVTFHKVDGTADPPNIMVYSLSPSPSATFYNVLLDGGSLPLIRPPFEDTGFTGKDFRNHPPYVNVKMWVPFVGMVDVDPSLVWYTQPKLRYQVDFTTGESVWVIYTGSESDAVILNSGTVTLGINMPIGQNNASSAALNGFMSTVGSVLALAATKGASAIGTVGAAVGGASALMNAGKVTGSAGTCSGGIGDLYSDRVFTCIIERRETRYPENIAHTYGLPSMKTRQISTLSGYTKVAEVHPEGIPCTNAELEEIESLLKTGVLL